MFELKYKMKKLMCFLSLTGMLKLFFECLKIVLKFNFDCRLTRFCRQRRLELPHISRVILDKILSMRLIPGSKNTIKLLTKMCLNVLLKYIDK
jgi:hypothetical protein